jgi:hypothetical protein
MPRMAATVSATKSPLVKGASSANQTPSGNLGSSCRAAAIATRVLPMPPGPVNVTIRCVATNSTTSVTAWSRPISSEDLVQRRLAAHDMIRTYSTLVARATPVGISALAISTQMR